LPWSTRRNVVRDTGGIVEIGDHTVPEPGGKIRRIHYPPGRGVRVVEIDAYRSREIGLRKNGENGVFYATVRELLRHPIESRLDVATGVTGSDRDCKPVATRAFGQRCQVAKPVRRILGCQDFHRRGLGCETELTAELAADLE